MLGCTKAALRVPLAVTWLTVYRQLQVPVRIVLVQRRPHGAKHSPPGSQGAPDCPGAHPPVHAPETPLSFHNLVRSILLQVTLSGAPSGGHPGVLLFVGLGTLCHMVTFAQNNEIKNSPRGLQSFFMFFRLVKVSYPCDNGNPCAWSQFSQNHEKS